MSRQQSKYPTEAKALIARLLNYCDDLVWGEDFGVGPRWANTRRTINFWQQDLSGKAKAKLVRENLRGVRYDKILPAEAIGFLRKLGPRMLLWHCEQKRTIYFTARENSGVKLLLVDIDDKANTAGDAAEVGTFLKRSFLPRSFLEASTHGKGCHLFFLLFDMTMETAALRAFLLKFSRFLDEQRVAAGFKSKVDLLKGLPSIYNNGLIGATNGGTLAKFPRELLTRWSEFPSKAYSVDELRAMMRPVSNPAPSRRSRRHAEAKTSPTATEAHVSATPASCLSSRGKELRGPQRRIRAFNEFIGQCPAGSLDDLMSYYANNWFHEGTDSHAQQIWRRDFARLLEKQQERGRKRERRTYVGATKVPPYVVGFNPQRYLPLVTHAISLTHCECPSRHKITHQKIADFIAVKIQDAFKDFDRFHARASREATIANFRTLKKKEKVGWIPNAHLYKQLLEILVKYDLLRIYDEYTAPVRSSGRFGPKGQKTWNGLARAIGPGPALPEEYGAFQKLWEQFQRFLHEQSASSSRAKKCNS